MSSMLILPNQPPIYQTTALLPLNANAGAEAVVVSPSPAIYLFDGAAWNLAAGGGSTTVTSVSGTSNQIICSPTTGAVVVSLSSTIVTPGTLSINSMTAGSIFFSGASGLVSQDNSNLFWNNSTKRLYIGTPTAISSDTLEINSTASTTGISLSYNGTVSWTIRSSNSSPALNFGDVSAVRMSLFVGGQVSIGTTPSAVTSAIFAIQSTTLGFLPPKMTTTQRDLIATPATGLVIFNTTTTDLEIDNGSTWAGSTTSGVTAIAGTANQVALSASTGSVVVSLTNGISIGSYQAIAAPTGGVIAPGNSSFGTSSPSASSKLTVEASSSYAILVQGTLITRDGSNNLGAICAFGSLVPTLDSGNVAAMYSSSVFGAPSTKTISRASGLYVYNIYSANVGTLTIAAGVFVDVGGSSSGTISAVYGGYFTTPTAGVVKAALYADNMAIGSAASSPEANSLFVIGKGYFGSGTGGGIAQLTLSTSSSIAQLHALGYSAIGGSDANNALIRLGFPTGGRAATLDYVGAGGTPTLYITNIYDDASTIIDFRLRAGGVTPITPLRIAGSGLVSCRTGGSANGLAATISAEFGTSAGSTGGAIKLYATSPAGNFGLIQCTDGNIHLDPYTNSALYCNFYSGSGGVIFGSGSATIVARVTGSGSLALNTPSSPTNTLDVPFGNVQIGFASGTVAPVFSLIVSNAIGIGTPNPSSQLEVNTINRVVDNGGGSGMAFIGSSEVATIDYGGTLYLGGSALTGSYSKVVYGAISGRKSNGTNANYAGYLQFALNTAGGTVAERMRITTDGFVGINTTTPAYFLDVASSDVIVARVTSSNVYGSFSRFTKTDATDRSWDLGATGSSSSVGDNCFSLYDGTAVAYRLSCNSTGEFLIGSSGPSTLSALTITKSNAYSLLLNASQTAVDGGSNAYGQLLINIMSPTSGGSIIGGIAVLTSFIAPSAQTISSAMSHWVYPVVSGNVGTITNLYGVNIDTGSSQAGTITNSYGLYVNRLTAGTNRYCAVFTGEVTIGATSTGAIYALNISLSNSTITNGVSCLNFYLKEGPTLGDFFATSIYQPANPTGGQNTVASIYSRPVMLLASGKTLSQVSSYFASSSVNDLAGTITGMYGFYYDGGTTITAGGTVTNNYGIRVATPLAGTNKICALFEGTVLPGTNKTYDLGSTGLRWNVVYNATNTTGTSRLAPALVSCSSCSQRMVRGTGTINIAGEVADYTPAWCDNEACSDFGNVKMDKIKHLCPTKLPFRLAPPKVKFKGFKVHRYSGNSRGIQALYEYEGLNEHGAPISNSTFLSDLEYDAFKLLDTVQQKQFLLELGTREWNALEEARLIDTHCSELEAELNNLTASFKDCCILEKE